MGYNEFGEIESFVKEVYDELDSLVKESIEKYGIIYPNSILTQTGRLNLKSREVVIEYNGAILKDKIKIIIEYWMDSVLKPSHIVFNIKAYDKDGKIIKGRES